MDDPILQYTLRYLGFVRTTTFLESRTLAFTKKWPVSVITSYLGGSQSPDLWVIVLCPDDGPK